MAIREPGREAGGSSGKFSYEIVEHIGVLAQYQTGWVKELNLISWNGSRPKYDIRDWDSNHVSMSRGITLHADEAEKLLDLLNKVDFTEKAADAALGADKADVCAAAEAAAV